MIKWYEWYLDSDDLDIWLLWVSIKHWLILNEHGLSNLPPDWPDWVLIKRCRFRWHFYALHFGGYGGRGIGYEWLGLRLEIGKNDVIAYDKSYWAHIASALTRRMRVCGYDEHRIRTKLRRLFNYKS